VSPDDFSFTLTIPGDAQFVPAVRALVVHAATYARLPEAEGAALADAVAAWARRAPAGRGARLEFERAPGRLVIQSGGEIIARFP
jgi:hypothetical protein